MKMRIYQRIFIRRMKLFKRGRKFGYLLKRGKTNEHFWRNGTLYGTVTTYNLKVK